LICVEVIVCYISVVFETQCIYVGRPKERKDARVYTLYSRRRRSFDCDAARSKSTTDCNRLSGLVTPATAKP